MNSDLDQSTQQDREWRPKDSVQGRSAFAGWWQLTQTGLTVVGLGVVWLWCLGFCYSLDDEAPWLVSRGMMLGVGVGIPSAYWLLRTRWLPVTVGFLMITLGLMLWLACMKPTHDRDWGRAQRKLPFAEFDRGNDAVTIHNIRKFRYVNSEAIENFATETFSLNELESVWFGVDRFTSVEPLAHTFLSFEFKNGEQSESTYIAFSVETRREQDELTYSPVRGIYNNYETIYVVADEQDVLSVRSDVREHVVQLYPILATPEQRKDLFLDLLGRVNSIRDKPEFYHTLTNNCTNNLVYHANKVLEQPISAWERGVVFPGYADWLAYENGMIDTDLSLEEARQRFRIDERAKTFPGTGSFSEYIRRRKIEAN